MRRALILLGVIHDPDGPTRTSRQRWLNGVLTVVLIVVVLSLMWVL